MLSKIAEYLVVITGASAVVIFLGKIITTKLLDIGIEKYKSKLALDSEIHKNQLNENLEKYKAELKIIELEHQIKYSSLHVNRSEFIYSLYKKLLEVQNALFNLTSPNQGPDWKFDEERATIAVDRVQKMNMDFQMNKILINTNLCDKIESIIELSNEIIDEMQEAKVLAQTFDKSDKADAVKRWSSQFKRVYNDSHNLRKELENEFRTLLGST